MKSSRDTALHSYAYLILKSEGSTFTDLADRLGCSNNLIKELLLGRRKSRRIQEEMAHQLGFASWDGFESQAQRFYDDFRRRLEGTLCG